MSGGVALQTRLEDASMWSTTPTIALVEEHKAVGALLKESAVPGRTSRTRSTMQNDSWLAMWIAAGLPVDAMAVIYLQEAVLVWLDLWI
jgi:hypothetical protein